MEVDRNGDTLWECIQGIPHHDVLKMPNGNVLLLSRQDKTAEEAIAAGANPDFIDTDGLMAPHIVEVKPTGPAKLRNRLGMVGVGPSDSRLRLEQGELRGGGRASGVD